MITKSHLDFILSRGFTKYGEFYLDLNFDFAKKLPRQIRCTSLRFSVIESGSYKGTYSIPTQRISGSSFYFNFDDVFFLCEKCALIFYPNKLVTIYSIPKKERKKAK